MTLIVEMVEIKITQANLVKKLGLTKEEAKFYMEMNNLIPVNEDGKVDGRKLHEVLKVEKAFNTWIQTQLDNVDAIKDEDFSVSFKGNAHFTQEEINKMLDFVYQRYQRFGFMIDDGELDLDILVERVAKAFDRKCSKPIDLF